MILWLTMCLISTNLHFFDHLRLKLTSIYVKYIFLSHTNLFKVFKDHKNPFKPLYKPWKSGIVAIIMSKIYKYVLFDHSTQKLTSIDVKKVIEFLLTRSQTIKIHINHHKNHEIEIVKVCNLKSWISLKKAKNLGKCYCYIWRHFDIVTLLNIIFDFIFGFPMKFYIR